jgi:hypothetical protein
VGLERGPLSLVSTTEEVLEEIVAVPVHKTKITAVGISRADHTTTLFPLKLVLTSETNSGRSVGIVRSRTKATGLLIKIKSKAIPVTVSGGL